MHNCTIAGEGLTVIARTDRDDAGRERPLFDLIGRGAVPGGGIRLACGCTIGELIRTLDTIRGDIDELIYRYGAGSRIRCGALAAFLAQWEGDERAGEGGAPSPADGEDGGAA